MTLIMRGRTVPKRYAVPPQEVSTSKEKHHPHIAPQALVSPSARGNGGTERPSICYVVPRPGPHGYHTSGFHSVAMYRLRLHPRPAGRCLRAPNTCKHGPQRRVNVQPFPPGSVDAPCIFGLCPATSDVWVTVQRIDGRMPATSDVLTCSCGAE